MLPIFFFFAKFMLFIFTPPPTFCFNELSLSLVNLIEYKKIAFIIRQ